MSNDVRPSPWVDVSTTLRGQALWLISRGELNKVVGDQPPVVRGTYHAVAAEAAQLAGRDEEAIEHVVLALTDLRADRRSAARQAATDTDVVAALATCASTLTRLQLFPLAAQAGTDAQIAAEVSGVSPIRPHVQLALNSAAWGLSLEHMQMRRESREKWSRAIALHDDVQASGAVLPPAMAAYADAVRAVIAAHLGDLADAGRRLDAARLAASGLPDSTMAAELRRLLAHAQGAVLLAGGEVASARHLLRQRWDSQDGGENQPWAEDVVYLLAAAAESAGDLVDALRWTREMHAREARRQMKVGVVGTELARIRIETADLRRAAERWQHSALTDALTGIANRRALDEALPERARVSRYTGRPMTIVMLDVDGFKRVNDVFGHDVGDEVLRRIGKLVRSHCRDVDFCGRYGGDEIVLLLEATRTESMRVLERLRAAVDGHPWSHVINDPSGDATISLTAGVAELGRDGDPQEALRTADTELLAAKRRRKAAAAASERTAPANAVPAPRIGAAPA